LDERAAADVVIPELVAPEVASEARFRLLVEQSPLVVYTHDGSRPPAMTYVSPQVEKMLGIEPARWLEQPFLWVTRIHPDDREDVLAQIDEACLDERRFIGEYRYRTQDDRVVWVRDEASPVRDDDGRVAYWQGALSDITDRKATEEAFKQSEHRSRLMIESVTDHAMVMIGPDGTIVSWNPGAQRLFGYTEAEALGQNISMFAPDGNRWREDETADLAFAIEHGPAEGEGWRLRKDGSRFWAHFVTTPVRDEQGHLVGLARVTRDLTERRESGRLITQRARQQAAVAELGMRALAHAAAEPLMDEATHMVARTLDLPLSALFLVTDESAPLESATLRLAFGTGWASGLVGSLEIPPDPGSLLWYSLVDGSPVVVAEAAAQVRRSLPPLLTDHGVVACASLALRVGARPIGVLLAASPRPIPFQDSEIYFLQEITNVVGSFLERARTEEMLKTLDTDRSRLLGRVLSSQEEERAHVSRELHDDLAQTLAGITLFAASLATSTEGQEKETSERIGEMAQDAADAVRRLIGDLRPLELEDGLAHATERLADIAGSRRGVPIQVQFEGSPQRLPDEVEVAVYRIVQEGLNNIGKHAATARAAVALRFHQRFVEIEIRDEGPGFEVDDIPSVGGEHVGLLGMHERAALIGAGLGVESTPGKGTTVRLRVPIAAEAEERQSA
jgi:PAS domain S-box-containing protein